MAFHCTFVERSLRLVQQYSTTVKTRRLLFKKKELLRRTSPSVKVLTKSVSTWRVKCRILPEIAEVDRVETRRVAVSQIDVVHETGRILSLDWAPEKSVGSVC